MRTRFFSITFFIAMMYVYNASASVIEHQGDRIIINVEEMELRGDESLLDILMTMPEVMTTDGRTQFSDTFYGQYAIRIDNLDIALDDESFLKNTKACDLKNIKICMNPGIMKGCGGMKKVIDLTLRKKDNGTTGTVNLEGSTYGNAATFNTVNYQRDNLNIRGWLTGNLSYKKAYGDGTRTNGSRQDAKMLMTWDVSPSDNIEFLLNQSVNRSREGSAPVASSQDLYSEFVYTHTFSNDAYGLFDIASTYDNFNAADGSHIRSVDPFFIIEFSFPLFSRNLWITPGIEGGYSGYTDVNGQVTDRQRYEDYYLQFDWTLKKFHLMVGDRFRTVTYWNNNDAFDHSWMNHYYTVSAWMDFNEHNTLQGTFAHRFFSPDNETFNLRDSKGNITGYDFKDVYMPDAFVSELRYTYQKKNLILTSLLQNVHQDFERGARRGEGNDNTITCGVTANWKATDWLRLVMGANYNHERYNNKANNYIVHNNFANIRFIPEITTNNGWRFLATMLYNSRRSSDETFAYYTMPNFYAALKVSKDIGKHMNVYVDAHDLADQRTGNRQAIIGATYKW